MKWRTYDKDGNVKAWIQRRCVECGRFLTKFQQTLCSKHDKRIENYHIRNPNAKYKRVIRHHGTPSKSKRSEMIIASRVYNKNLYHKSFGSNRYRNPYNNKRLKNNLEILQAKFPEAIIEIKPYCK